MAERHGTHRAPGRRSAPGVPGAVREALRPTAIPVAAPIRHAGE
jgi:hypothetical protein